MGRGMELRPEQNKGDSEHEYETEDEETARGQHRKEVA